MVVGQVLHLRRWDQGDSRSFVTRSVLKDSWGLLSLDGCYAQHPKGSRGLLTLNGRCSRRDRLPFSSVGGWWSIELPRDDDMRGRTSRILIIAYTKDTMDISISGDLHSAY